MTETASPAALPTRRPVWRRLWPVAVLATGLAAFFALGLDRYVSFSALAEHRQTLQALVADHRAATVAGYIVVYALATAFSVPGAVWLTIGGGFVFGPWWATLYAVSGATAGAVVVFLAARHAFRDWVARKAGGAVQRMEAGFREDAVSYMLVLRLVPLFPFWLVNLVPALLGVRLLPYTLTTAVGIIPGGFVYALVGNGLGRVLEAGGRPDAGIIFTPEVLAPLLGLAVLALLPVAYRRWRRRQHTLALGDEQ